VIQIIGGHSNNAAIVGTVLPFWRHLRGAISFFQKERMTVAALQLQYLRHPIVIEG
jgi:hypothetical protein